MKRFGTLLLTCLLALLILSSVAEARKIRGSGDVIRETREISGVDGVELATIGKLIIEIGDKEELIIEAEDNLIEYFETDVRGGMLIIDKIGRASIRPTEKIRYYLTVKELTEIQISSSGDIEAPDLKAERFQIEISSSGNFEMGDLIANSLDIRIESSGDVEMGNVSARDVEIEISSSGDVEMRNLEDTRLLVVDISSSGDVEVFGGQADDLDISINSSGDFNGKRLECKEAEVSLSSSGDATVNVSDYLRARLGSSGDLFYIGEPRVDKEIGSSGRVKHIR